MTIICVDDVLCALLNSNYRLMKKVFEFRDMPLSAWDGVGDDPLARFGEEELKELVSTQFSYFAGNMVNVVTEFRRVRFFVRSHHEEFLVNTAKANQPERLKLQLTGERGVFTQLFASSDVFNPPIPLYLHMADKMIASRKNQSDTERSGGRFSAILVPERSLLADDIVEALVFLAVNLPELHEIDTDALVDAWVKAGGKLPIAHGANQVIERFRNKSSKTFLFKKNMHT